ncbi:MAG: very short patch repair endonuclease [Elusimicrobia bacterium]|nr:very short patch repair endonuclease [Elusimicrobiota bacterium]
MDTVSKPRRSKIMAAVKSRGNVSTEAAVRRIFLAKGVTGWRRHLNSIPGKPDFAFRSARVAVFVDGCFWHGCKSCRRNITPSTNNEYWRQKIKRNQERDRKVNADLRKSRWRVVRIWEHAIANAPAKVVQRIQNLLDRQTRSPEPLNNRLLTARQPLVNRLRTARLPFPNRAAYRALPLFAFYP